MTLKLDPYTFRWGSLLSKLYGMPLCKLMTGTPWAARSTARVISLGSENLVNISCDF